jgi:hypothetical protein
MFLTFRTKFTIHWIYVACEGSVVIHYWFAWKNQCYLVTHEHLGHPWNVVLDGQDVFHLLAIASFEYANLDLGITNYRHIVVYFGDAIKWSYCMEFPIDKTLGHSSSIIAWHYANCLNDNRFMDTQQMYTYKLAIEAWHWLLQLNGSLVNPPRSSTSTIDIPIVIDQPNNHCPL